MMLWALTGRHVPISALCLAEKPELDEITLERVLEELETMCYENMNIAIETEEGLGIEYDEDVVCDVCRSPEGEDGNEMVFCDKCNVCVHQVSSSPRAASLSVLPPAPLSFSPVIFYSSSSVNVLVVPGPCQAVGSLAPRDKQHGCWLPFSLHVLLDLPWWWTFQLHQLCHTSQSFCPSFPAL